MSPQLRGWLHVIAGLAVPTALFANFPDPWNMVLGAAAAAVIAASAFLDQSLSK